MSVSDLEMIREPVCAAAASFAVTASAWQDRLTCGLPDWVQQSAGRDELPSGARRPGLGPGQAQSLTPV